VVRSHAGDGGRPDGSSGDHGGAVEPSHPAPTLGRPQTAGPTSQAEESAGGRRGCMTTVVCELPERVLPARQTVPVAGSTPHRGEPGLCRVGTMNPLVRAKGVEEADADQMAHPL
jgi:hypothetical protein